MAHGKKPKVGMNMYEPKGDSRLAKGHGLASQLSLGPSGFGPSGELRERAKHRAKLKNNTSRGSGVCIAGQGFLRILRRL